MISLIFAMDQNNLIGKDNDLPWNYSEDLKYFRNTTRNKTVLMGDRTFLSIVSRLGKPLPKRKNIVATLDKEFNYEGIEITYSLIDYLKQAKEKEEEIFVIGGKSIYALSLPFADRLYITHIHKEYEGNVYFPPIPFEQFEKVKTTWGVESPELEFVVYERRKHDNN